MLDKNPCHESVKSHNKSDIDKFLDFLVDPIVIIDENSHIVFTNKSCDSLFGFSNDELKNMKLGQLMAKDLIEGHDEMVKLFVTNNSPSKSMIYRDLIPCVNSVGREFFAKISIGCIEYRGQQCGIASIQDHSLLKIKMDKLAIEANTDHLTGLFNKRYLDFVTSNDIILRSSDSSFGIVYLDLNKFKAINDNLGHDAGDCLLKTTGKRLSKSLRSRDMCFRVGGDEFVLLVAIDIDKDPFATLQAIGAKIHSLITKPIKLDGESIKIGVSIGMSTFSVGSKQTLDQVIDIADKAMLTSKKEGSSFRIEI